MVLQVKLDKLSAGPVSRVIKASPKQETNLAQDDDEAPVTSNSAYTTSQPHDFRGKDASFGSSGCKISTETHEDRASPTESTLEGTDRKPSFEFFRSYRNLLHFAVCSQF